MFAKAGITCLGKFVTGLEGCFELLQQREKLPAEGVLDSRGLVSVLGSQDTTQAANLRLNTADATDALEGGAQLTQRQPRALRRRRRLGPD